MKAEEAFRVFNNVYKSKKKIAHLLVPENLPKIYKKILEAARDGKSYVHYPICKIYSEGTYKDLVIDGVMDSLKENGYKVTSEYSIEDRETVIMISFGHCDSNYICQSKGKSKSFLTC